MDPKQLLMVFTPQAGPNYILCKVSVSQCKKIHNILHSKKKTALIFHIIYDNFFYTPKITV